MSFVHIQHNDVEGHTPSKQTSNQLSVNKLTPCHIQLNAKKTPIAYFLIGLKVPSFLSSLIIVFLKQIVALKANEGCDDHRDDDKGKDTKKGG